MVAAKLMSYVYLLFFLRCFRVLSMMRDVYVVRLGMKVSVLIFSICLLKMIKLLNFQAFRQKMKK